MAINTTSSSGSNAATSTGSASSSKRPLQLTNCQLIDCTNNSVSSGTTSTNRYQARNVCWNKSGSLLAVGCSDATIRFWNPVTQQLLDSTTTTGIVSPCKDVGTIHTISNLTSGASSNQSSGYHHGGPIIAATFHPTSDPILCSMTAGSGILRLWDVRGGSVNTSITSSSISNTATSTNVPLPIVVSVEWNPIQTHIIANTTHDGSVSIYDTRKFTNTTTTTTNAVLKNSSVNTSALVRKIQFPYNDRIESCIFDRSTGQYIMAGVTNRDVSSSTGGGGGMGYIKLCAWDTEHSKVQDDTNKITTSNTKTKNNSVSTRGQSQQQNQIQWYSYPAHAGPIYTIATNCQGTQIASGGSDAVVGLWDVSTMTCCKTISSRTKFIRALSFSHDDQMLAIATEEDVIEIIDCSNLTTSSSIHRIGLASLSPNSNTGRRSMTSIAGAEDISFHPTAPYLLACARTTDSNTSSGMSSVTLLRLTTS